MERGRRLRCLGEERAAWLVPSRTAEALLRTAEFARVKKETPAIPLGVRKLMEMPKDDKSRGLGNLVTFALSSLTFGNDVSQY